MTPGNAVHTAEQQYLDLLAQVLDGGARKSDRTRIAALAVFGSHAYFGYFFQWILYTLPVLGVSGRLVNEVSK
jgi:hypothetical protein